MSLARPVSALVLVAMDVEAQPFLSALAPAGVRAPEVAGTHSWRLQVPREVGDQERHDLVLVRCGIGLVNAASALAGTLAQIAPRRVISAGTAGGLSREVEVGDVCVSDHLAYTDADATAFGYVRGQIPGMPALFDADPSLVERATAVGPQALAAATSTSGSAHLHTGQMLSGNSFVTATNVADTRQAFPEAVSTDMESTALAQVAASVGLPFISVRGVSDLCGPQAGQDFHIGAEEAAARSAAVVLALLD